MYFSKSVLLTVVAIATLAVKAIPNPSSAHEPVNEEEEDIDIDEELLDDDDYSYGYDYFSVPAPIAPVVTATPCAPCTPKTVTSVLVRRSLLEVRGRRGAGGRRKEENFFFQTYDACFVDTPSHSHIVSSLFFLSRLKL